MGRKELHSEFTFQIEPKHYARHNYLTFCNDMLVSILQYVDEHRLSTIKVQFQNSSDTEQFNKICKESGNWQQWLLENGYKTDLYESFFRHTFFSLISDFCNYMLESINCAAKMKVAVSYALLRKPLKDTLGYIEWLYIDRDGMLNLLVNGNPKQLEISRPIAKEHTSILEQEYGKNSYFDFRYNKDSKTSLEQIWNNANHLITTHNEISNTEQGNLNFVFADETMLRDFSDYYYATVPAIMSYAIDLICEIFEGFAPLNQYTISMNKLNRILRSLKMIESISFNSAKEVYSDLDVPIICPRCGLKMKMTDKRVLKFVSGKCTCRRCLKLVKTGRYIFDWENINFVFEN